MKRLGVLVQDVFAIALNLLLALPSIVLAVLGIFRDSLGTRHAQRINVEIAPVFGEASLDVDAFPRARGTQARRRVAVIGGGIAGMATAWALDAAGHSVQLFEASATALGGHTHTLGGNVLVPGLGPSSADGAAAWERLRSIGQTVDVGFMICNPNHYRGIFRWFELLGGDLKVRATQNSFSAFSYLTRTGWSSAASLFSAVRARFGSLARLVRLMRQLHRFHTHGPVFAATMPDMSVEQFALTQGYSREFLDDYLVPVVASLWSSAYDAARQSSVHFVIRFMHNHQMLAIFRRSVWYTLIGGSSRYIERFLTAFSGTVQLGARVESVRRERDGCWSIQCATAAAHVSEPYDAIVFATHPPVSARILASSVESVPAELRQAVVPILARLEYYSSTVYVHTDASYMPAARELWASWNSITLPNGDVVCTYWITELQFRGPARAVDVFVTVVPLGSQADTRPAQASWIVAPLDMSHPKMLVATEAARKGAFDAVQRPDVGVFFAGSAFGNGFHEDGFRSGMAAARMVLASFANR